MFVGYKHYTLEEIPRCFYVGKGSELRPYDTRRNHKWKGIVKRYGCNVVICFQSFDEKSVFDWEIENIKIENTFSSDHNHDSDDIGCNFTLGGEGPAGLKRSEETRKNMSLGQKGHEVKQKTREKISASNTGKTKHFSDEHRMFLSEKGKSFGKRMSSHTLKLNQSRIGTHLTKNHKAKLGIKNSSNFTNKQ